MARKTKAVVGVALDGTTGHEAEVVGVVNRARIGDGSRGADGRFVPGRRPVPAPEAPQAKGKRGA
jgi:hypothetical protein